MRFGQKIVKQQETYAFRWKMASATNSLVAIHKYANLNKSVYYFCAINRQHRNISSDSELIHSKILILQSICPFRFFLW